LFCGTLLSDVMLKYNVLHSSLFEVFCQLFLQQSSEAET